MDAVLYPLTADENEASDNGLVKCEFHYQLHDRIQFGNLLCVVLAGGLTWLLRARVSLDLRLCAVVLAEASVCLLAAFSRIRCLRIFRAVGYCWRDGKTTVIECGEKEYRLASVVEMIGGETRFFFARGATLSITTERDIFEVFSLPLDSDKPFEDSSVYPLCQFVLESFPYLQSIEMPGQKTKHRYVRIDR